MKILIDNGHNKSTLGKCSPDKSFYEWSWTRKVAEALHKRLDEEGIDNVWLFPGEEEGELQERVRKINSLVTGKSSDYLLVSIHSNAAASDGKWHNATGSSVFVSPNSSVNSKRFANIFYKYVEEAGLQGNRSVPKERYWVANFYILRNTKCPAVLTENLFQDNKDEVKYMLSEEGLKTIVDIHLKAIKEYIG